LVLEYKKPTKEVREYYIYNKLKDGGIDVDSEKVKNDIKRYVEKTEGYTFDFVKELVQGIYIDDIDEETVFERINKSIAHNGVYKITEEDGRKIGFHGDDKEESETRCNPVYLEESTDMPNPYDPEYDDYDQDQSPRPVKHGKIMPLHEL
jgi:hypothetical protein